MNRLKHILATAIVTVALYGVSANATTYYAVENGNWSDINNWTTSPDGVTVVESAIPGPGDDVVIAFGRAVTLDGNVTVNNLELLGDIKIPTGKLTVINTLSGNGGVELRDFDNCLSAGNDQLTQFATVIVTGDNVQISNSRIFNNLTVNGSAKAGEQMRVNGTLTINGTFEFGSGANTIYVNNITVGNNGLFRGRNTITTLNLTGNLISNGQVSLMQSGAYQNVVLQLTGGNEQLLDFRNAAMKSTIYRVLMQKTKGTVAAIRASSSAALEFSSYCGNNVNDQPLVLTSGTLKLEQGVTITKLGRGALTDGHAPRTDAFIIPENAGLWIGGANVGLGYTGNRYGLIWLEGELRISSGSLSFTNLSEGIVYNGDNAVFTIEGGSVTASGIRPNGITRSGVIAYTQTGGNLNFTQRAGNRNTYSPLYIDGEDSRYVVSGGTVTFSTQNLGTNDERGANGFVVSVPTSNYSVTGGTVKVIGGNSNAFQIRSDAPFYNFEVDNGNVLLKQSWLQHKDFYAINNIDLKNEARMSIENIALHLGRNLTVSANSSIQSDKSLYIFGNNNTVINDLSNSGSGTQMKNVMIEKGNAAATVTIANSKLRVSGNLSVDMGVLSGNIDMNGGSEQIIQNSRGNMEAVNMTISGSDVKTASDLSINSISIGNNKYINIGSHNLRLAQVFVASEKTIKVITNGNGTDGGLTMPIASGATVYFPLGYGKDISQCLGAKIKSNNQSGMMTVAPSKVIHPSMPTDASFLGWGLLNPYSDPLELYWHIEWDGNTAFTINGFNYTFYHSDNSLTTNSDIKVYQLINSEWKQCSGSLSKGKNADGTLTVTSFNENQYSGDFSSCHKGAMVGNSAHGATVYYSKKNGDWNNYQTWVTDDPNSTSNKWGSNGTPNEQDMVVIQKGHTVTIPGSGNNKAAASIEIQEGCTLVVNSRNGAIPVSEISGDGTLIYKFNENNNNFITADYTKFAASSKATMIFEVKGTIQWPAKQFISTYPNLTIRPMDTDGGTDMLCVTSLSSFTVNGDLKIEKKGNRNVHFSTKNNSNNDFVFTVNGDMTVAAGCEYSTTIQQNSKQYYYGNIVNNGTFTNNGSDDPSLLRNNKLYLYGNLENNGTFTATGYFDYYLTGEREQIINGTQQIKAYHVILDKVNSTDKVWVQTPLVNRNNVNDPVQLQLKNGYMVFDVANRVWRVESYRTEQQYGNYKDEVDSLFRIPATATVDVRNNGTLNLSKHTNNIALWLDGVLKLQGSADLQTNNRGIVYGNSGVSTLSVGSESVVTSKFIQPIDNTSNITFTQSGNSQVSLSGDAGGDWATLDIRGGRFELKNGAVMNIAAASGSNNNCIYFAPSNAVMNSTGKMVVNGAGYIEATKPFAAMEVNQPVTLRSAVTFNNTLTLNNQFTTQSNNVTLLGNSVLATASNYVAGNNTTTFSGGNQTMTCASGVVNFYQLVRNGSGNATLPAFRANADIDVQNGNLNLSAASVAKKNVRVAVSSAIMGQALEMSGAGVPVLECRGTIDRLTIATNVNASVQQTMPITIKNNLSLTAGMLNIGGNELYLWPGATVTANGNPANMIGSAMTTMSEGISVGISSPNVNFTLPVGKATGAATAGDYMPVTMAFSAQNYGSDAKVNIKSIDLDHSLVVAGEGATPFWSVSFNTVYPVAVASSSLTCVIPDNRLPSSYELDDLCIGILDAATYRWTLYPANEHVVVADGKATITFPKVIAGDYVLAHKDKFKNLETYVSVADGNATQDAIWQMLDDNGAPIGDVTTVDKDNFTCKKMIIRHNVVVTEDQLLPHVLEIEQQGVLDLTNTRRHIFSSFIGTGTLRVQRGTLPASSNRAFYGQGGGTLEVYANGSPQPAEFAILSGFSTINNLRLNNVTVSLPKKSEDTHLYGSLTLVNNASFTLKSKLLLDGDLSIESGCVLGGDSDGSLVFNGNSTQEVDTPDNFEFGSIINIAKDNGKVMINSNVTIMNRLILTRGIVVMGENTLSIYRYASVTSGNSNSFVDGLLRLYVNSSNMVEFPVGDNTRFGKMALNPQTSGYFSVRYYNQAPENYGNVSGITGLSTYEYWKVASDDAGRQSTFRLFWDANSNVAIENNRATFALYNSSSAVWESLPAGVISGTANQGYASSTQLVTTNANGVYVSFAATEIQEELDVKWTGIVDDDWYNEDNWSNGRVPTKDVNEITIGVVAAGSHYPVIRYDANRAILTVKNIVIENDAKLTLDSAPMTVTGNITAQSGAFIIRHGVDRTASFVTTTNTITNVMVEREYKKRRTYYVGSANASGAVAEATGTGTLILKKYDPETEEYTNVTAENKVYTGTVGRAAANPTWTLKQLANIEKLGQKQFTISTIPGEYWGWHLIANPLPVAINLTSDINFSSSTDIDPVIWLRSEISGTRVWTTFNRSLNVGVNMTIQDEPNTQAGEAFVAPYQAFFVKIKNGTAAARKTGTVTIKKADTKQPHQGSGTATKSVENVASDVLRLTLETDNAICDEVALVCREGGSFATTWDDADKRSESDSYNSLAVDKAGNLLAIASLPQVSLMNNVEIELAASTAAKAQEATIKATNIELFDHSVDVFLIDRVNDVIVDLREDNTYIYTPSALDQGRFALLMLPAAKTDPTISAIEQVSNAEVISTKTFNIVGAAATETERGVTLRVETLSNGTQRVVKQLNE